MLSKLLNPFWAESSAIALGEPELCWTAFPINRNSGRRPQKNPAAVDTQASFLFPRCSIAPELKNVEENPV
jgi:hypothetical protein